MKVPGTLTILQVHFRGSPVNSPVLKFLELKAGNKHVTESRNMMGACEKG